MTLYLEERLGLIVSPQNSTSLDARGLWCSTKNCLEKSLTRKLKQECRWQAGGVMRSPTRVCFQMWASYFLEGDPPSANLCISSTKMAVNEAGFRPSSEEVVAAPVMHHSGETLERTPCPVGEVCVSGTSSHGLLQGSSQLGATVMLFFRWPLANDLARPSRPWPFPPITGSLRALCWVCTRARWHTPAHPAPSPWLSQKLLQQTSSFLTLSQHQFPDNPASSGAIIKSLHADWLDPKESSAKANKGNRIGLSL